MRHIADTGQKDFHVLIYIGVCTRSLMDRTKASDAFNAGSIPVGCSTGIIRTKTKRFVFSWQKEERENRIRIPM